jgi:hypothetical protein
MRPSSPIAAGITALLLLAAVDEVVRNYPVRQPVLWMR